MRTEKARNAVASAAAPGFVFSGTAAARRDSMKLVAKINSVAAIRDNGNRAGLVIAEIDLAGLTPEQRKCLADLDHSHSTYSGMPDDAAVVCGYDRGILDLANLVAFLDSRIAQAAAEEAGKKTRLEQYIASARSKLAAGELPHLTLFHSANAEIEQWPEYRALETRRLQAEAARAAAGRLASEKEKAEKAERAAAVKADMAAWITANGSARLRRCLAEGVECAAAYRDERLVMERPGWVLDTDGTDSEPRNPPDEAFALLDEARKTAPDAKLNYLTYEDQTDEETGDVTAGWRGYVAVAEFLGRTIRYGGPTE